MYIERRLSSSVPARFTQNFAFPYFTRPLPPLRPVPVVFCIFRISCFVFAFILFGVYAACWMEWEGMGRNRTACAAVICQWTICLFHGFVLFQTHVCACYCCFVCNQNMKGTSEEMAIRLVHGKKMAKLCRKGQWGANRRKVWKLWSVVKGWVK